MATYAKSTKTFYTIVIDVLTVVQEYGITIAVVLAMSFVTGIMSPFVIQRRLQFYADTLGHSMLLAIGLGYWLHLSENQLPYLYYSYSLVLALLLSYIKLKKNWDWTSINAVVFSLCTSAGILLINSAPGEQHEHSSHRILDTIVGTSLDSIQIIDLYSLLLVCAIFTVFVVFYRKDFILMAVSEKFASYNGVPIRLIEILFMMLISVGIAACIKMAGIILVTAFITLPGLIAKNFAQSFKSTLLSAAIMSLCSAVIGLCLAIVVHWRIAPTIVLVLATFLVISHYLPLIGKLKYSK